MDDREKRRHDQIKLTLKIIGISLIVIGAILVIVGMVDFFSAMNSEDMHAPTKFWCLFVGLPCLGIGIAMTVFGYRQEITRYIKNESVDVINEASSEMAPAVANIASAVKDGITEDGIRCECGEVNDPGSKFCKSCGKPLDKTCPKCGASNDADATFCNECGEKID